MIYLVIAVVAPVSLAVVLGFIDYVEQKRYYDRTYGFRPERDGTEN